MAEDVVLKALSLVFNGVKDWEGGRNERSANALGNKEN